MKFVKNWIEFKNHFVDFMFVFMEHSKLKILSNSRRRKNFSIFGNDSQFSFVNQLRTTEKFTINLNKLLDNQQLPTNTKMSNFEKEFSSSYQHQFSNEALKVLETIHNTPDYKIIKNTVNDPGREKDFTRNQKDEITRFGYQCYLNEKEQTLKGVVYFGKQVEGPPGCVHGGAIATIIDGAMGTLTWVSGYKAVTVNLNVDYRRFIPLDSEVALEMKINKIEGRKIFVKGTVKSLNGEVLHNDGSAIFLQIKL
jgi:acyl-coenzyme A thioesterase PaaI-like protein